MTKQLIIDLAVCDRCSTGMVNPAQHGESASDQQAASCSVQCGAILALREKVTFELICRRCEHASCIVACPFDALERTEDGVIKRHNLRCVSCKSCAIACPFGTIYMELLPFYSVDFETSCEQCLTGSGAVPACAETCSQGAIEYREIQPDEEGIHHVDENLAARIGPRAQAWARTETAP